MLLLLLAAPFANDPAIQERSQRLLAQGFSGQTQLVSIVALVLVGSVGSIMVQQPCATSRQAHKQCDWVVSQGKKGLGQIFLVLAPCCSTLRTGIRNHAHHLIVSRKLIINTLKK